MSSKLKDFFEKTSLRRITSDTCANKINRVCQPGYVKVAYGGDLCTSFCVKDTSKPTPSPCPTTRNLVCGMDGVTYYNPCVANLQNVQIAYVGACKPSQQPTPPEPPLPNNQKCAHIYDPVCDNDSGQTYNNACEAIRAGAINFTRGKCAIINPNNSTGNNPNSYGNGAGGSIGGKGLC